MKGSVIYRLFVCLFMIFIFLYLYVLKQNDVTLLRLEIPILESQIDALEEKNGLLQYYLDQRQGPAHLIDWLEEPDFSHLYFPSKQEVVIVEKLRQDKEKS